MKITYKTQGTCSSHIEVEVEDDVVQQVFFWGGCNGNLQGISRLVKGMKVEDVISKLEGVKCGNRSTSCPDQLCYAAIQKHLEECGFEEVGGDFTYIPNDLKDVTPEQRETIDKMVERLEEFDDVQTVYTNMKPAEEE